MLIESGGGAVHIGIMAAIMMGGSSFTQLFFAPYISNSAGTLLVTASGGFWTINEGVPSALKISGIKDYLAILRSELADNK